MIRAFVVDDEPLAVTRLARMLEETGRVEVAGTSTDPVDALAALGEHAPDVLFLDIQMPGMTGFEMLSLLEPQPLVVFTTAYDQYALQAFEVNSIDYLLKPVEERHLARALDKLDRLRAAPAPPPDWKNVLAQISAAIGAPAPARIASRLGERIHILDLVKVSHFFAQDKLTYAATEGKTYVIDYTVTELEQRFDPLQFCRIHRSTLLNLAWVREVDAWFGGRVLVRLKDSKATELQVARDRVAELKKRVGDLVVGLAGPRYHVPGWAALLCARLGRATMCPVRPRYYVPGAAALLCARCGRATMCPVGPRYYVST